MASRFSISPRSHAENCSSKTALMETFRRRRLFFHPSTVQASKPSEHTEVSLGLVPTDLIDSSKESSSAGCFPGFFLSFASCFSSRRISYFWACSSQSFKKESHCDRVYHISFSSSFVYLQSTSITWVSSRNMIDPAVAELLFPVRGAIKRWHSPSESDSSPCVTDSSDVLSVGYPSAKRFVSFLAILFLIALMLDGELEDEC
mmetsp:Transcript_3959/g.8634  ORF Transcript_3959/g.8634 Transcript_3959/m.8634 type:complete len:203 (-) Transcript_3959:423-1031(-)